jgi:tetratricopeptide (TPR) repeat protein
VQSIRELQQLTRQAEANIPTKDQQLMIERYRKYTQEIQDRKHQPEDNSQETVRTVEPEPAVPGLEHKPSAIEKYRDFEPTEINRGAERAPTAETQTDNTLRYPVEGTLESNLTLAEAYEHANAMTAQYKSIPTEGDIDIQDQREMLDLDIVEQVKKQLEDLIKSIDQKEALETTGAGADTKTNIDLSSGVLSHGENSLIPHKSVIEGLDELKGLSQADLSAKAKKIRGSHTNPNAFSLSRFNHHFQEAQDHLKSGKYYAAANSYALASIYKPDEPLCLAGRGHALLGAGEYISSALFLSRAIEAEPEYMRAKIDLAATLGGQHILDSRVADIREWLLRSGSGKLDFLLSYVYYRMGRLGPAQQAIGAAYAKMSQSVAVVTVKKAVDNAIAGK